MKVTNVLRSLFILLCMFACAFAGSIGGPAGETPRYSLEQAKRLAFERNWDLLAAKSDVDLAMAAKIISKEFPNPSLALSTGKINVDGQTSATNGRNDVWSRSYDTIASVNQLFEIGGKRKWRQASAQAGYEASKARLLDSKRLLDVAVTKAFIAALLSQSNSAILRESAEGLRKEAEIAITRLKAGDISVSDKTQIEITAERLETEARTAEANARSARIALDTLLGTPKPAGDFGMDGSLESLAAERVPLIDPDRPPPRADLLAGEAALRKAEADLHFQKALRVPDPTFFAQYEHEPPDQPNSIGVGISIPLPLWNRNRGGILAAQAAAGQASVQLGKIRSQIVSEIALAQVGYQDAFSRWEKFRNEITPRSGQLRETVSFAYEKGGASLLDLLSAERNNNEVRLATAQAAADTAVSIAMLRSFHEPLETNADHENKH